MEKGYILNIRKITLAIVVAFILAGNGLFANAIVGKWKTIDDETGETKSIVNITEWNGYYFGNIEKLFRKPHEDQDPKCDKCQGEDHNKRIIGLQIIKNMKKDGNEYTGGTILDPKNGKVYRCKMWIDENGKLKVRGYLGPFFRTQTWHRVQ